MEVGSILRQAAFEAEDVFTKAPIGSIEQRAMDEERLHFASWLDAAATASLAVEPLPYRRAISDDEARSWLDQIKRCWPIEDSGWWQPIVEEAAPGNTLALDDSCFWDDYDAGPATLAVRTALGWMGVERVIELREFGPSY
jgi:hypothetical protein